MRKKNEEKRERERAKRKSHGTKRSSTNASFNIAQGVHDFQSWWIVKPLDRSSAELAGNRLTAFTTTAHRSDAFISMRDKFKIPAAAASLSPQAHTLSYRSSPMTPRFFCPFSFSLSPCLSYIPLVFSRALWPPLFRVSVIPPNQC